MKPFIVYALPRSRTFWLSKFLAYGSRVVLHDICVEAPSMAEIIDILERPDIGVVDTGLVNGWRLVKKYVPQAKTAVIKRPTKQVCESLKKFGIENDGAMQNRMMSLDKASEEDGVLSVYFNDLDKEETAKAIFEHCLELEFDRDWWLFWKDKNIQIDMPSRLQRLALNRYKIEALKAEAARMSA